MGHWRSENYLNFIGFCSLICTILLQIKVQSVIIMIANKKCFTISLPRSQRIGELDIRLTNNPLIDIS